MEMRKIYVFFCQHNNIYVNLNEIIIHNIKRIMSKYSLYEKITVLFHNNKYMLYEKITIIISRLTSF